MLRETSLCKRVRENPCLQMKKAETSSLLRDSYEDRQSKIQSFPMVQGSLKNYVVDQQKLYLDLGTSLCKVSHTFNIFVLEN